MPESGTERADEKMQKIGEYREIQLCEKYKKKLKIREETENRKEH